MFENMNELEKDKELKYRFAQINGGKNQFKWDLNTYVNETYIFENMIKVEFMYKFTMNFDIMRRLSEEFPTCNLRVEADSDRLVLIIEH